MVRQAPTVVYTGPGFALDVLQPLVAEGFCLKHHEGDARQLKDLLSDADALLDASMKVPLDQTMFDAAPELKLIAAASTGSSHIDPVALERHGCTLLTLKGQSKLLNGLTPAAELSWALLMSAARRLRPAFADVQSGLWNRVDFPGTMLRKKKLGLIGFGRLGQWMSRYAKAFEMEYSFFDPFVDEPASKKSETLEELVADADFVSVHIHLSNETQGLINQTLLHHFKEGSVLINTSRGEILDEHHVVAALEAGKLSAVAVDVLWSEPEPEESPLWQYSRSHDNVLITPHIGGFSPDAVREVVAFSANRILQYFG